MFRQDVFSYWAPLDRKFVTMMLRLCETEHVGLISFFWSNQLFAYLDYAPELEHLPYRELNQRFTRAAYGNMREGKFSSVGELLRQTTAGWEKR